MPLAIPPKGRVIVYIATSLDGYVARKNDDLSWLEAYNTAGEDHGYAEFFKNVGTAIMGARAYEQSLKHPERMLTGIKNYILSEAPMEVPAGVDVSFYKGDLAALIGNIRKQGNKDIFVVGGGRVVSSFLNAGLVDELLHFVAPILLKEGIPLYPALDEEISLILKETVSYKSGIVKLHYVARKQCQ
jgi:dihydrofolate reductase